MYMVSHDIPDYEWHRLSSLSHSRPKPTPALTVVSIMTMHYSGKKKHAGWSLGTRLLFSRLLMNGCVDTDPNCTVSLYCGSMLCGSILAVTASKGAYQNRVVSHWTKRASYPHFQAVHWDHWSLVIHQQYCQYIYPVQYPINLHWLWFLT